jgi:hypothetical protein
VCYFVSLNCAQLVTERPGMHAAAVSQALQAGARVGSFADMFTADEVYGGWSLLRLCDILSERMALSCVCLRVSSVLYGTDA